MRFQITLTVFLAAAVARGATYVVGSDRDMVRSSTAIVVVTAGQSVSVLGPRGTIETSARMHVDEAIAGPLGTGDDIDVVELGGMAGGHGLAVMGAPRFAPGERGLLLLEHDDDGAWTTKAMGLGRFTFERDVAGRDLLVRDEAEIFGWDVDGTAHQEQRRAAELFLRFVRATARGGNPPVDYFVPRNRLISSVEELPKQSNAAPASTYCIQSSFQGTNIPIRWNSFPTPVVFSTVGSQPGATNGGLTAAGRGIATWTNNPTSDINYQLGGTRATSGGLQTSDGVESILFNDPNNEIPGSFSATQGGVLLHVYEELAQHRGQLEITRDLLRARPGLV